MKTKDIEKFKGFKTKIEYKKIMVKYANKAKDKLVATSPDSGRNRATPYRTGWTVMERYVDGGFEETVWNETNWQLTHLLENGHFISNRTDGLFWSPPNKHIHDAFNSVKDKYVRAMKKVDVDIDFK